MDESPAQREPLLQSYSSGAAPQSSSPGYAPVRGEELRWGSAPEPAQQPSGWPEQQASAQWPVRDAAPQAGQSAGAPPDGRSSRGPNTPMNAGYPASSWPQGNGSPGPNSPQAGTNRSQGVKPAAVSQQSPGQANGSGQGPPAVNGNEGQGPVWPGDDVAQRSQGNDASV